MPGGGEGSCATPCPTDHRDQLRVGNVPSRQPHRGRDPDPVSSHLHRVRIYPHTLRKAAKVKPHKFSRTSEQGELREKEGERRRRKKTLLAGFQGPKPEWKCFPSLNCFETR